MKFFSVVLFFICAFTAQAQSTFERHYSYTSIREVSRFIFETADSGFVIQSNTDDPWTNSIFRRTDKNGNLLWEKVYGTDSIQYKVYGMTRTSDGGYVVCGDHQTVLTYPSMDSYIMKIDSSGDMQWFNPYGWTTAQGGGKDHGTMVRSMSNGNLVVEGFSKDVYFGPNNYGSLDAFNSYLGIFDQNGNMIDISSIVVKLDSTFTLRYHLLDMEVINNNIFWLGTASNPIIPYGEQLLAAFDQNLDTIFVHRYGFNGDHGLTSTQDGHLIIFGDSIITKMDTLGNIVWNTPFQLNNCRIHEMHEQADGTFIAIGGKTHTSVFDGTLSYINPNNEVYIIKLSSTGNVLWSTLYAPFALTSDYRGYDILSTKDGGLAFAGYYAEKSWLVKTDSIGLQNYAGIEDHVKNDLVLYPNPADGIVTIAAENEYAGANISIYNSIGELVEASVMKTSSAQLNISHLPKGIYFVRVSSNERVMMKKLIKN